MVFSGYFGFLYLYRHDINEILLKVTLNTIIVTLLIGTYNGSNSRVAGFKSDYVICAYHDYKYCEIDSVRFSLTFTLIFNWLQCLIHQILYNITFWLYAKHGHSLIRNRKLFALYDHPDSTPVFGGSLLLVFLVFCSVFLCVLCTVLSVSLDCPSLIPTSIFVNVYVLTEWNENTLINLHILLYDITFDLYYSRQYNVIVPSIL